MDIGDEVRKVVGDYRFYGIVIMAGEKLDGKLRYVVENQDGILHVFTGNQLAAGWSTIDPDLRAKGQALRQRRAARG